MRTARHLLFVFHTADSGCTDHPSRLHADRIRAVCWLELTVRVGCFRLVKVIRGYGAERPLSPLPDIQWAEAELFLVRSGRLYWLIARSPTRICAACWRIETSLLPAPGGRRLVCSDNESLFGFVRLD